MKRVTIVIFFVLLTIAAFLAAIPFLVSSQTVRNGITAKLEQLTGLKVTFQGEPSLSFSPFLGFEISDLVLTSTPEAQDDKPLLKVEKVKAQINLLPALTGNVEITEYQFLRPKFYLKTDKDGKANWEFTDGEFYKTTQQTIDNRTNQTDDPLPEFIMGDLMITDGILIYEDEISKTNRTITGMNGIVSWAQFDSSLNIAGNGIWRGEGITTNLSIDNPMEILSGGESTVEIEVNSQPVSFTFEGAANMFANLFVKGQLEATSPSINRLAQVLEIDLGGFTSSDPWSAQGLLEATSNNTNLSEASFSIGDDTATGVIRISADKSDKSKLDGTLAFESIDLVNYFNSLGLTLEKKITPTIANNLNIDLRVSSQSINVGAITLDKVAAAIIMDEQGWTFDIGDASAFEGKLVAKLGERIDENKRQSFLELSATDMDAQQITDLLDTKLVGISGKTSFVANIRTNKLSEGFLNSGLNGTFSANFSDGQITGIDLHDLVSKKEDDTSSGTFEFSNESSTPFQNMKIKLFLNNGIAAVSQSNIETSSGKIQAIGDINLYDGKLDLQLQEINENGPTPYRHLLKGDTTNPSITFQNGKGLLNQN